MGYSVSEKGNFVKEVEVFEEVCDCQSKFMVILTKEDSLEGKLRNQGGFQQQNTRKLFIYNQKDKTGTIIIINNKKKQIMTLRL